MWTENIWCVFRMKTPFSNFSGVVWTGAQKLFIHTHATNWKFESKNQSQGLKWVNKLSKLKSSISFIYLRNGHIAYITGQRRALNKLLHVGYWKMESQIHKYFKCENIECTR